MKLIKSLFFVSLLICGGNAHADTYTIQSGLTITSIRNLSDRVMVTFDQNGVCETNTYTLLLTDSDPDSDPTITRRREALLSKLLLAAAAKNTISLEIWAACPATPEERWGLSFDLLGVIVHF